MASTSSSPENDRKRDETPPEIAADRPEKRPRAERGVLPALQSAVESAMCAITKSLMTDPVIALDGMTYERKAIAEYFGDRERAESPVTREEIATTLIPNVALRNTIQALMNADGALPPLDTAEWWLSESKRGDDQLYSARCYERVRNLLTQEIAVSDDADLKRLRKCISLASASLAAIRAAADPEEAQTLYIESASLSLDDYAAERAAVGNAAAVGARALARAARSIDEVDEATVQKAQRAFDMLEAHGSLVEAARGETTEILEQLRGKHMVRVTFDREIAAQDGLGKLSRGLWPPPSLVTTVLSHPLRKGIDLVLGQVHPGKALTVGAISVMTDILGWLLGCLVACLSVGNDAAESTTADAVVSVLPFVLSGELIRHARSEACKAVLKANEKHSGASDLSAWLQSEEAGTITQDAGLVFSVPLLGSALTQLGVRRVTVTAAVAAAATLEYMCAEMLELAGNAASDLAVAQAVTSRCICLAIHGDEELDNVIRGDIVGGGVIPFLQPSLVDAKSVDRNDVDEEIVLVTGSSSDGKVKGEAVEHYTHFVDPCYPGFEADDEADVLSRATLARCAARAGVAAFCPSMCDSLSKNFRKVLKSWIARAILRLDMRGGHELESNDVRYALKDTIRAPPVNPFGFGDVPFLNACATEWDNLMRSERTADESAARVLIYSHLDLQHLAAEAQVARSEGTAEVEEFWVRLTKETPLFAGMLQDQDGEPALKFQEAETLAPTLLGVAASAAQERTLMLEAAILVIESDARANHVSSFSSRSIHAQNIILPGNSLGLSPRHECSTRLKKLQPELTKLRHLWLRLAHLASAGVGAVKDLIDASDIDLDKETREEFLSEHDDDCERLRMTIAEQVVSAQDLVSAALGTMSGEAKAREQAEFAWTAALETCRAEQRSTRELLERDKFARFVGTITQTGVKWSFSALVMLQAAAERHLVRKLESMNLCALTRGARSNVVQAVDSELYERLTRDYRGDALQVS